MGPASCRCSTPLRDQHTTLKRCFCQDSILTHHGRWCRGRESNSHDLAIAPMYIGVRSETLGGRGENRTLMTVRSQDFESCASTSSATRPPSVSDVSQFRHRGSNEHHGFLPFLKGEQTRGAQRIRNWLLGVNCPLAPVGPVP